MRNERKVKSGFYIPETSVPRIRYWLPIVGVMYLSACFSLSGVAMLVAIVGRNPGEFIPFIPWLHWPLKLLQYIA